MVKALWDDYGRSNRVKTQFPFFYTPCIQLLNTILSGGKYIPPPDAGPKKSNGKVFKLGNDMYSVHTHQKHRTICHVPSGNINIARNHFRLPSLCSFLFPGGPHSCSFPACRASMELSERNDVAFSCKHVQKVLSTGGNEPEESLQVVECR